MTRKNYLSLYHKQADHRDDDADLVLRLRNGDEVALGQLIRAYQGPLARYIDQMVQSRDTTEDVLQDTFIHLWDTRARIDPSKSLRPYLYRIARNLALNALDSTTARQRREALASHDEAATVDAPSLSLERHEFETAVHLAVDALPSRCREVFVLVRDHQMTYTEVAALLGVSVSTVKTQMGRAMTTLATRLAPFLVVTLLARASGL